MDKWLIDRFDAAGRWAQRRGWLMTEINVHAAAMTVIVTVGEPAVKSRWGWALVALVVWGAALIWQMRRADQHRDYPENVRMTEELNVEVLRCRESQWGFRAAMMVMLAIQVLITIVGHDKLDAVTTLVAVLVLAINFYVLTCTFMGPGEHGRVRKEATHGQEARAPR